MKAVGIIRKLDNLGRLTIPSELRKSFNLEEFTPMEIFADDKGIFVKKYEKTCTFCGGEEDIILHRNKHICRNCIESLKNK